MRCSRCSTEAAPEDEFCAGCGARLRSVRSSDVTIVAAARPAGPPGGHLGYPSQPSASQPFPAAGPGGWPGVPAAAAGRRGPVTLSVLALLAGLIGAGLIVYVYRDDLSRLSWFFAQPLGIAGLSIVAGVLIVTAIRSPGRQWLGSGLLLAFGVNILLGFTSLLVYSSSLTATQYEFTAAGGALLIAGLLGVAAAARKRG